MLRDVVDRLACPHCRSRVELVDRSLRCRSGHSFDIARQGYVSLLPGGGTAIEGDSSAMIAARGAFLGAGHFEPVAARVAEAVAVRADDAVLDIGAGTGYYLAAALDRLDGVVGIALDVSKFACRAAAKAHPRVGAVVGDAWRGLPVRDGGVSVVLNVFAPRHPAEMARVLAPGGHLVVVTPNPDHLSELVRGLGLISVDERKQERLDDQLGTTFTPVRRERCEFAMSLPDEDIATVVAMGPSARHLSGETLRERIAGLPSGEVTASVTVATYRA